MSDYLADLRARAEAATPGPWSLTWDVGPTEPYPTVAGPSGLWIGTEKDDDEVAGKQRAEATQRHIATFDPPTVMALLDVVEAAADIESPDYTEQPGPYATGIGREEAIALTEALARLRTLTGEDQ